MLVRREHFDQYFLDAFMPRKCDVWATSNPDPLWMMKTVHEQAAKFVTYWWNQYPIAYMAVTKAGYLWGQSSYYIDLYPCARQGIRMVREDIREWMDELGMPRFTAHVPVHRKADWKFLELCGGAPEGHHPYAGWDEEAIFSYGFYNPRKAN